MVDEITLTIDGREVKTTPGTNVLQAAMDAGIYVPYLCYYPGMKAFGACRMCVVEIEDGPPGSQASCTVPASDGMVINTKTESITDIRRGIMDLLISEHPHGCLTCHRIDLCGPTDICLRHVSVNDRCVTCPKNERCELKDTVRFLEMDLDTPLTYNNRHLPLKVDDPFWEMDMNLCIVCGRCVRVCDEVRGDNALTFTDRSGRSLIGTSHGTSLLESGCEFCGACIDVCPTGALVEREHKWSKATKTVTSICPHCPVGCQMKLEVDKRDQLIRTTPDIHAPANKGQVCFKGKFGLEFVNSQKRLRKPLIKLNGTLTETSLTKALDFVSENLTKYRGDQYAMIVSPRSTNEDSYIAQKFTRTVMGTNNIDISSNVRPELMRPLELARLHQGATNPIWDLENSKGFLVVSSNLTEEQNVVAVPIKKAVKTGSTLIVIDPRETELTRFATVWLRPKPGSETALVGGMLRVIIDESLDDHAFLAEHCMGVKELKDSLWKFDLVQVSALTAIPEAQIQETARLLANSSPSAILYGLETLSPDTREACAQALINLALVTGNIGKSSTGLYPLYQGANEQGAKDMGCVSDYLPDYQPVASENARQIFESEWNTQISSSKGLSLKEISESIRRGTITALHLIGNSASYTNGDLGNFVESLEKLELLIVQDSFASELTEQADVVLPSSTFAEKDGTYTNIERRVQLLRPLLGPKGDQEADWRIISQIGKRMGARGFDHDDAESVFQEISSVQTSYGGLSHHLLHSGGRQWPYASPDSENPPILYTEDGPNNKVVLTPMSLSETPVHSHPKYPFLLAKGRLLHDEDRVMEIGKNGSRTTIERDEVIELHEEDSRELGIEENEWVNVVSETGTLRALAKLTSPHKGLASTTALFGQLATELELSEAPDPMLKVGGLPLVPVRIEKLRQEITD